VQFGVEPAARFGAEQKNFDSSVFSGTDKKKKNTNGELQSKVDSYSPFPLSILMPDRARNA
jgi:hypothetical protein